MKFWTVIAATLRAQPPTGIKITTIPAYEIVEADDITSSDNYKVFPGYGYYRQITWRTKTGWVYDGLLDPYNRPSELEGSTVFIPDEIAIPGRPKQYVIWEGATKFNRCGDFDCAYIGHDPITDFWTKWKYTHKKHYNAIVPRDKVTGYADLDTMLTVYGYQAPNTRMADALYDKTLQLSIMTPGKLQARLTSEYLIANVKINKKGELDPAGKTPHWVVVERVEPLLINDGWVFLYNSFWNRPERYTYQHFDHCHYDLGGLFIPRAINLSN